MLALLGTLALAACAGSDDGEDSVVAGDPNAPNFVIVETDDQSMATFTRRALPNAFRLLAERGTTFSDSVASPPRCCPSRAGLLTGQYPHNHGILWNRPDELTQPESTLATWLADEGYETALVGKFLNGYVTEDNLEAAPGFSEWFALSAENEPSYTDPAVSDNGEARTFDDTYLTSLINRRAETFVENAGEGPFFLWQAHYAPHPRRTDWEPCEGFAPAPLPRDYPPFADAQPPRGPAYDEADVSDKPESIASLPRLTAGKHEQAARNYRCALASLQAVDRGVARVEAALRRTGELEDTLFVFTSDNGMMFGEHRFSHGKVEPYEESLRVPLVVAAGADVLGSPQPRRVGELVAQIDLAPTLLELAGADGCSGGECRALDGRSLVGLLEGRTEWPRDRGILVELQPPKECGYRAIRTPDRILVERRRDRGSGCEADELELYDLRADPHQLENVAASEPVQVAKLQKRLAELASCSGSGCE
jgi:arylsulfatase A-like enzyme